MRRKPALLSKFVAPTLLFAGWVPHGALAQCQPGSVCSRSPLSNTTTKTYRQGRWYVVETANFQACSEDTEAAARRCAEHVEVLRTELASKWFGSPADKPWTPRCQIVLHSGRTSYVAAVGRGSEGTLGSSAVTFDAGKITRRRIDLLAVDAASLANVLPHELTHVLLRDRFTSATLPRWADEGMAMLADTDAKQARHVRDLQAAIAGGREYLAADLLAMRDYPRTDRRQAYYGQSVFVTKFLVAQKDPRHFVKFLERAGKVGHDAALKECYEISGAAQLDRLWRRSLYTVQLVSTKGS